MLAAVLALAGASAGALTKALTGDAACYAGYYGGGDPCAIETSTDAAGTVIIAPSRDLVAGENIIIAVGFTPGIIIVQYTPPEDLSVILTALGPKPKNGARLRLDTTDQKLGDRLERLRGSITDQREGRQAAGLPAGPARLPGIPARVAPPCSPRTSPGSPAR
ncbi:hypothetical protein [Cryobacterium sp. TMB1-7]|uniref:hypothetical protein n=1 Tax=Cryobacterium sp. TMB1-7 TaxID=2555866 RepID=UPI00141B89DE|nr:hypothetical protein [Cryobacterium sp. TMB1-7]